MGAPPQAHAAWDTPAASVQAALADQERARDAALADAHAVVANARRAIAAAHQGDHTTVASATKETLAALHALEHRLRAEPIILHGGILDGARQEATEAALVDAYLHGRPPPDHVSVGVPAAAYAGALGDLVGELRRFALGALTRDDVDGARSHLRAMEAAYAALQTLDAPRGIAPVKRAQDVARSLLDRTLGEVTVAAAAARLTASVPKDQHR